VIHRIAALSSAALVASLVFSAHALAGDALVIPIGENSVGPCGGDPITAPLVVQGQFPASLMGAYVMLPVEVPPGTTQIRVKYCYESPGDNTVDLGLWQARVGDAPWGEPEFRGWGGSSHPDVAVTAQGFSTEAEFLADRKGHVAGRTTRGFVPGPIPAGTWAIELGVGAVAETDADQLADWRVEIALSSDPAFAADPYAPATYDASPAIDAPGWYAGDLHVHAEHSSLNDALMREVFDYAFAPLEQSGAGLDFITLSDYVTTSAWGEIGRYQASYPEKLIIRSAEIITYQGHAMNHGSAHYVDHRAGPVYELAPDGALTLLRAGRPPAEMFAEIQQAGGAVQLNHVTTCPSDSEYCRRTCRGCPWDYDALATGYADVDAIEVQSGSFFKYALFTAAAIAFWDDARADGFAIAPVGSSDSHSACVPPDCDALDSPIGQATTKVWAASLSAQDILDGIRAGHTYVKLFGNDGPDLTFDALADTGETGMMGDAVPGPATLTATASAIELGARQHFLKLYRDGAVAESIAIDAPGEDHAFRAEEGGRYRAQLERDDTTPSNPNKPDVVVAITNEITVPEPDAVAAALVALAAVAYCAARSMGAQGSAKVSGA
jgi:hypothetical protein